MDNSPKNARKHLISCPNWADRLPDHIPNSWYLQRHLPAKAQLHQPTPVLLDIVETQLEDWKCLFSPKLISQFVNQEMFLGFKHFPLAFMLLSSDSELSLPHPLFICKAEMKTICSLQPLFSDLLPAHVSLFYFDLVVFPATEHFSKSWATCLDWDRWSHKWVQGHTASEEASAGWS